MTTGLNGEFVALTAIAPSPPVLDFSPTKLIQGAKLLPQDLSHYTPDRLQDLGDLIPDFTVLQAGLADVQKLAMLAVSP